MIVHLENEASTHVSSTGGLVKAGGGAVSAITLDGGTASTGATLVLYDGTSTSGTEIWALRAAQYKCETIVFTKPIPFTDGLYKSLTPSGISAKVSIAYI